LLEVSVLSKVLRKLYKIDDGVEGDGRTMTKEAAKDAPNV
jgi:hypothetical protein